MKRFFGTPASPQPSTVVLNTNPPPIRFGLLCVPMHFKERSIEISVNRLPVKIEFVSEDSKDFNAVLISLDSGKSLEENTKILQEEQYELPVFVVLIPSDHPLTTAEQFISACKENVTYLGSEHPQQWNAWSTGFETICKAALDKNDVIEQRQTELNVIKQRFNGNPKITKSGKLFLKDLDSTNSGLLDLYNLISGYLLSPLGEAPDSLHAEMLKFQKGFFEVLYFYHPETFAVKRTYTFDESPTGKIMRAIVKCLYSSVLDEKNPKQQASAICQFFDIHTLLANRAALYEVQDHIRNRLKQETGLRGLVSRMLELPEIMKGDKALKQTLLSVRESLAEDRDERDAETALVRWSEQMRVTPLDLVSMIHQASAAIKKQRELDKDLQTIFDYTHLTPLLRATLMLKLMSFYFTQTNWNLEYQELYPLYLKLLMSFLHYYPETILAGLQDGSFPADPNLTTKDPACYSLFLIKEKPYYLTYVTLDSILEAYAPEGFKESLQKAYDEKADIKSFYTRYLIEFLYNHSLSCEFPINASFEVVQHSRHSQKMIREVLQHLDPDNILLLPPNDLTGLSVRFNLLRMVPLIKQACEDTNWFSELSDEPLRDNLLRLCPTKNSFH